LKETTLQNLNDIAAGISVNLLILCSYS